jgi:hypothetical protein
MAEETEPKRDISEVLLAMDVVDTLRHEQALVERELQLEENDAALVEKLRRIYTSQGIEVTDDVLIQGVQALRDERFTYHPPKPGLQTILARLYVGRGRWGKAAAILIVAVLALWGGYRFLYAGPAERARVQIVQEAAELATEIGKHALEPGARQKADALKEQATSAIRADDLDTARDAVAAMGILRDLVQQTYTLQVVSRPGAPSGVWRQSSQNPAGRNYYLIVEAVTADGRRLELPVISEEDGKTKLVKEWGLRVPAEVYEQVRRDKAEDGIVDARTVGVKQRGFITPEYRVQTSGGAITEW